jgi:hypothetical protein
MEIQEVTLTRFSEFVKIPYFAFNSGAFNNLHRAKCDRLFYLLFTDGKYRMGLIGGSIGDKFLSPISAPFGGFTFVAENVRLQHIEESIEALNLWAVQNKFSLIRLILPPVIYHRTFLAKQLNCLWRKGFEISGIDLNYAFELETFNEAYPDNIWYNARKNLHRSLAEGLVFIECQTIDEKLKAFEIIKQNRERKNFPLRMSWDQILETIQIIPADFFLVTSQQKTPIASAIVFRISNYIVQVIYWGDIEGYVELRPMNFLSFMIFNYYKKCDIKFVDIGPSTAQSVPNYGLCEFKEGIGCRIDPKFILEKKIDGSFKP